MTEPKRQAFCCVRRRKRFRPYAGQNLELLARGDLTKLNREGLLGQPVIIRLVKCVEEFSQPARAKDGKRLAARTGLRRVLCAEEKRRKAPYVVQMKVADPDGVEPDPVKLLFSHAMYDGSRRIQQDGTLCGLQPVRAGCASRMRDGRA